MAVISRSDLQYTYTWTAVQGDNPRLTGSPDRELLNRNEGYEVLHYLNDVCKSREVALKAERMIRNHLPNDIRSRTRITDWLNANWGNH